MTNCPPGRHVARLREPARGPYLARFVTDEPPTGRTLGPASTISAQISPISRLWGRPRLVTCVPAMFLHIVLDPPPLHIVPTPPLLHIVPTRRAPPARPPRPLSGCHAPRCAQASAQCVPRTPLLPTHRAPPPPCPHLVCDALLFFALRCRSRGGHVPGKTPHWRVIVMAFPMQGRCLQSHS